MNRNRMTAVFGALSIVFATAACSDSSEPPQGVNPAATPAPGTTANPDSPAGAPAPGMVAATPGACAQSQIEILFSPMFSAFDGVHRFQVPATVNGIDPAAIVWSISDPTIADLQPAADGVMITVQKPGNAVVIATAGTLCGTAPLTVTPADPASWEVGNARYNSGDVITIGQGGGGPMRQPDGTREAACTSCHGDTATMGPFKTVSHTPMQTGGFSDQQLIQIFTMGLLPENAYFDDEIVSREQWSRFHRWTMTPEQSSAMVVYLRSLAPQSQKGERADFGGRRMRGDGGVPGGRGRRDGGARDGGAQD